MKTEQKVLAKFLAAAIWADGKIDAAETEVIHEIEKNSGAKNLENDVKTELESINKLTENELNVLLKDSAKKVETKEKDGILDLCMEVMCADSILSIEEVDNFYEFADLLGITESRAKEIMNDFVNEEPGLEIEPCKEA